jgi:myo-inositol catabolism protein IolH
MGGDVAGMISYAGGLVTQVHLADCFDHRASSGLRYIVNPPGSTARVHQHLDIGQGEVDFEALFASLAAVGFEGILTSCVFAWEDRADDSARVMRRAIDDLVARHLS